MHISLRWKILAFTALAPVALAVGTLWVVNRSVSEHVNDGIHENLRRSSRVFENMLSARATALEVTAQVIVRDPRFFSILTLPASASDPEYQSTVRGVASDFRAITGSDLFEVLGSQGALLASVGTGHSTKASRSSLVKMALRGQKQAGILMERDRHYQVTVTPVYAGGRVTGVLVLGAQIGGTLATRLRSLTHSEVTFISDTVVTGSTLTESEDRAALLETLEAVEPKQARDTVIAVNGSNGTYVTLARRIPSSNPGDRQFFVMQRSLNVETAFMREVQTAMLELGAIAILAALAMGLWVAERITRPVQHLVRGAEEMKKGNYDYPLAVRSHDEIGYLAERFLEMRKREKDYVANLQEVARIKSEFIAIASHELRTPISVIKGFIELFSQGTLGVMTPDQSSAITAIERSVDHLTQLAEDATRVAQIEGGRLSLNLEEHPVATLVREAIEMAVKDAPNRYIRISKTVEASLNTACVDGPRLMHALSNLVRNGIRFTPDGGGVALKAWREGEILAIEVKDTGVGIAPDRLKDIFSHSFSPGDSMHHHSSPELEFNSAGLGLGLATARGIVEAHGGTVEVASTVGKGSTFTIRVPYRGLQSVEEAA